MKRITNSGYKGGGKEGFFVLSGFGAKAEGETVGKILQYGNDNDIDVVTVEKNGTQGQPGLYSTEALVNQILEAREPMIHNYDSLIFIANSMTSPAFLEAYRQISQKGKDQIEKIIFLSPAFNMKRTIQQKIITCGGNPDNITSEILHSLGALSQVQVDANKMFEELEIYNFDFARKILAELGEKADIYMNPEDQIILPNETREILDPYNNLYVTSSIDGDFTHHNIDINNERVFEKSLGIS